MPERARNRSAPSSKDRGRPRSDPRPFDFRHPSTMSREHVRTLQIVQETLAQGFTTTLASALRAVTSVSIREIEQQPYLEYIESVPNPALLTMLSLEPLGGMSLLQIPLRAAYAATELMLGGRGGPNQPLRAMTELELALMKKIVELLLPVVRTAFDPVVAITPAISGQESNPQFAQVAVPTDMMIVISFELKVEAVSDVMTLCIPFGALQPHLEALSASARIGALSADKLAQERVRLHHHLVEASVRAAAMFRPTVASSRQVVSLRVGDTIMLNHPVEMPLTLEVDGIAVHDVHIGRINRHLAVQVADSVDPARVRRPVRLQVAARAAPPA
jgi:flagellar motor switch protein FliM